MKAFVTGSTGLLGNNLVRTLLKEGWEVKALARSEEKAQRLLGDTEAEIVVGDMEDIPAFAPHLEGVNTLFHVAAYFREYYQPGDHWLKLERINVTGTVQLLEEAERRGVQKAIYTSSSGVLKLAPGATVMDETALYRDFSEENLYFKSKVQAEKGVYKFLEEHDLPVAIILPGWMFGPWDAAPTGSGQMVLDFLGSKLPGMIDGGSFIVDARDVAQAMVAAVERAQSGERFIVAGEYASLTEIAQTLEAISGVPAPTLRLPYPLIMAYAWISERLAGLTGATPLITTRSVRVMGDDTVVSSQRAVEQLGASFRPLEETLRDEVAWYREHI